MDAALDKKAEGITILDLEDLGTITDFFVLCHGHSARQVQAIADRIEERLKQEGIRPGHVEGYHSAEWVLMDYVDFVVHIFSEEKRNFYNLERLWSDAPRVPIDAGPRRQARGRGDDAG